MLLERGLTSGGEVVDDEMDELPGLSGDVTGWATGPVWTDAVEGRCCRGFRAETVWDAKRRRDHELSPMLWA